MPNLYWSVKVWFHKIWSHQNMAKLDQIARSSALISASHASLVSVDCETLQTIPLLKTAGMKIAGSPHWSYCTRNRCYNSLYPLYPITIPKKTLHPVFSHDFPLNGTPSNSHEVTSVSYHPPSDNTILNPPLAGEQYCHSDETLL